MSWRMGDATRDCMSQFNALIFDFNGLIVDDEPIHCELFQKVLGDEEITLTEKDYWESYLGFDDKGLIEAVFDKNAKKLTPKKLNELIQKKNELYFPTLSKKLKFFPGALDFIREMKNKYPLAIVSGALRSEIEFVLGEGGVLDLFDPIISADDTKHGKPDPEGYVLAYTKLKKIFPEIVPTTVLALEDSLAGIESAKRAQLRVAALTHTYPRARLEEETPDYLFDNFTQVRAIL